VPRNQHDRTIVLHLGWDEKAQEFVVEVNYRLEVDEFTAVFDDMQPFSDQVDAARIRGKPRAFYGEYTRLYAPVLAGNLTAKVNGRDLQFTCVRHGHTLEDEQGQALGHLRCDFVFRAAFPGRTEAPQQFQLREGNYELQTGRIDLSLVRDRGVKIDAKTEPDAALKARADKDLQPGDEERLRQVSATFEHVTDLPGEASVPQVTGRATDPPGDEGLLRLFLGADDRYLWVVLLMAAGLGAVHALTPGHGKTLVAAYLVGEHGTTAHALVLGLVTTLTHTGVVFAIALGLLFVGEETRRQVQAGLGLAMGLLVASLGVWLFLRRLAGRADHIHIGGHGHHHHHGHHHDHAHADHDHDPHGNVVPRQRPVSWWGLIVLGMSGGIVPCWDAVAVLVVAVGADRLGLALPLLLAFSAGLAGVLVLIGIFVVHVRGFAQSHWGEGRLVRALPLVSAAAITSLGLWLCYDSIHTAEPAPSAPARAVAPPS
jgi:ABC-type nickel/cobalt efflux system permease component RcnA